MKRIKITTLRRRVLPNPDEKTSVEAAKVGYFNSEKGRAALRRYARSEAGKAATRRYFETEAGKDATRKAASKYYHNKKKRGDELAKAYLKWLETNPTGAPEEFLQILEQPNSKFNSKIPKKGEN